VQLLCDRKGTRRDWTLKEKAQMALCGRQLWKSLWTCRKTDYGMNE
jgi:hypothetical protein